jgi:acetyltransferase-like isoleucine patch superfamily enzyme
MPIDAQVSIDETALVDPGAQIGAGTKIWHHCQIRAGARIGAECSLGKNVYIDAGAVIGDRCKIQNNVSIYRGVTLEDEVLVGPSAVFTNDLYPRATDDWQVLPTKVGRGASIGANATIVCGIEIGAFAMVGAGSVVTHDVAPHELVVGNPARRHGWVSECGRLLQRSTGPFVGGHCENCGRDYVP